MVFSFPSSPSTSCGKSATIGSLWVVLLIAFVGRLVGVFGADFFVQRLSFLAALYGLLLATVGWRLVRTLIFPLALLLFMVRIPLFIYSQITFPLQLFASTVAAELLTWLGIPVFQDGNILELSTG